MTLKSWRLIRWLGWLQTRIDWWMSNGTGDLNGGDVWHWEAGDWSNDYACCKLRELLTTVREIWVEAVTLRSWRFISWWRIVANQGWLIDKQQGRGPWVEASEWHREAGDWSADCAYLQIRTDWLINNSNRDLSGGESDWFITVTGILVEEANDIEKPEIDQLFVLGCKLGRGIWVEAMSDIEKLEID